jgi:hypothetical protein
MPKVTILLTGCWDIVLVTFFKPVVGVKVKKLSDYFPHDDIYGEKQRSHYFFQIWVG